MNIDKYTIKAQEAIQAAIRRASNERQQAIEPEHLMAGVMSVGDNVTKYIFNKLGVNGDQLQRIIDNQIHTLPRVTGGEPYLSSTANDVLLKAEELSSKAGDEFTGLEALLSRAL